MGRTILIGDVHGCCDELSDLLAHVGLTASDQVVMVGDLVVRGPKPTETLALLRKIDARSVRGNHEDRLLRWRQKKKSNAPLKIGPVTRRTALLLKKKDWEFIEKLPLSLDLPDHDLRVVHAGVVPGLSIEDQNPRTLMNIRSLSRAAPGWPIEGSEERDGVSWAQSYEGPPHVVFGHNAKPSPEIAEWATGIDTGAVYGGRLTAIVLRAGERLPPPAERPDLLISVPSRRAYVTR